MQTVLRLTAHVQQGGRIELADAQLPVGSDVEVIVVLPAQSPRVRRSITAVLAAAPGHLAFETPEEVDAYLRAERDAWER